MTTLLELKADDMKLQANKPVRRCSDPILKRSLPRLISYESRYSKASFKLFTGQMIFYMDILSLHHLVKIIL